MAGGGGRGGGGISLVKSRVNFINYDVSQKVLKMLLIFTYFCPIANEHSSKTHTTLYYEASIKCCVSNFLHLVPRQNKNFTVLIPDNQYLI